MRQKVVSFLRHLLFWSVLSGLVGLLGWVLMIVSAPVRIWLICGLVIVCQFSLLLMLFLIRPMLTRYWRFRGWLRADDHRL